MRTSILISVVAWVCLQGCAVRKLGPDLPTQKALAAVDSPSTEQRYAIYIPKKPIVGRFIVGFTPDGGAAQLNERLAEAAEKSRAVVLVPHRVGDGPWDPIEKTMQRVAKDLRDLGAKPTETFTVGFSGGSRMAMRFAYQQHLQGVVACGGFFPWKVMPTDQSPPLVVGFVGERDLGRSEMATAEVFFDQMEAPAWFEYFDAGHQWPTAGDLSRALDKLLAFERLQAGDKPRADDSEQELARAEGWKATKPHWAVHHLRQIIRWYPSAVAQGAKSRLIEWLQDERIAAIERDLNLIEALQTTTQPSEFDRAYTLAQAIERDPTHPLHARAASLSTGVYDVVTQRAVMFARESLPSKATALLQLVERKPPEEPNLYYNLACAYALLGNADQALSHLQRALELGFNDKALARRDPDLKKLAADPRFRAMVD